MGEGCYSPRGAGGGVVMSLSSLTSAPYWWALPRDQRGLQDEVHSGQPQEQRRWTKEVRRANEGSSEHMHC